MTLPLLISNPHAGWSIPDFVKPYCCLNEQDIAADGDEGAAIIYDLAQDVQAYVTSDIARAIIDMNRAENDRRPDGVVKTHTCWNVPVYDPFPPAEIVEEILDRFYRPYHRRLSELSNRVRLGIDCHTMTAAAPPIESEPGEKRPFICLSDWNSRSISSEWMGNLADCFAEAFEIDVSINDPFQGGYIIQSHCRELPWVQLELSRAPFNSYLEKRKRMLQAMESFCRKMF